MVDFDAIIIGDPTSACESGDGPADAETARCPDQDFNEILAALPFAAGVL